MGDGEERRGQPADEHRRPGGPGREEAACLAAEGAGELSRAPGDRTPGHELEPTAAPPTAAGGGGEGRRTFRASVVVATLGRAGRLPGLVEAVLADPATSELVVVVDGPDPDSERTLARLAASRPRLRPVVIDHRGHLGALEEGVRRAWGDVVVLLDDDVVPSPGTIGGHLAHHRRTGGLVVAGPMPVATAAGTLAGVGTRLYAADYLGHVAALERGDVRLLDAFWAGNVSLRRADCLRIGLASGEFRVFYHSDRDLGYRLADAGLVGVFDPALTAAHVHRRTDAEFLRDAARQGAGRVALHRAHPSRLGPFRIGELVQDLPRPARAAIRLAGGCPWATHIGTVLLAAGRHLDRMTGALETELEAAKLARRVMQWHGARRAQAEG